MYTRHLIALSTTFGLIACLDPLVEDSIPIGPLIEGRDGPFIEDVPEMKAQVAAFTQNINYVQGYAEGQRVWYWIVEGINANFIAPAYYFIDADGNNVMVTNADGESVTHPAIIDVIPTDPGYTPWWRRVNVRITDAYDGQIFRSREAIDAGIRAGLLEAPENTTIVRSCPVVHRDIRVQVSVSGEVASPTWVWYREQKVHWISFTNEVFVPEGQNAMPAAPVFMLQRINQSFPINEPLTGVDLNGDQRLDASNNIFTMGAGSNEYTPLWFPTVVRVREDYVSIDNAPSPDDVELTDIESIVMFEEDEPVLRIDQDTALSLETDRTTLINCPIQPQMGSL